MRMTRLSAALAATVFAVAVPLLIVPAAHASTGNAVTMANYAFAPAALTVHVGDVVTWTNTDKAPHDVTTTSGPVSIHSAMLMTGQSWQYTFTTPGTYSYICSIHPDMHASVVVKAAPSTPAKPHPSSASAAVSTHASAVVPASRRSSTAVTSPSKPAISTPAASSAPASSTSAAAPVAVAGSGSSSSGGELKPLLILAGGVAALVTFCLLVLASRPESASTS